MMEIPLTKGLVALVDDKDYEWLMQWKWYATKSKGCFYAARKQSIRGHSKRKIILMHRSLLNPPSDMSIDHVDGNGLNNQRANLRIVSVRQNGQNLQKKNTSIYPGVFWYKSIGKWCSRIRINGKIKHLGYFMYELDAFRAYYDAVLELGESVLGFDYPNISEEEKEIFKLSNPNFTKGIKGINCKIPDDVIYYLNAKEASQKGGFTPSSISLCCTGKLKSHRGYTWEHIRKDEVPIS